MFDPLWRPLQPGRWGWWATVVVGVAALAVIGLRPTVLRQSAPRVTVLLTPGADQDALERMIDSLHPGRVVRTDDVSQWPGYPVVRDIQQLVARFPDTESVVVLGWGLEEVLLDSVFVPVTARLAPPPTGITATYPHTLPFGRVLHVTGRAFGVGPSSTVVLDDPLGPVDSAVTNDDGIFALTYRPRAAGPMELELTVTGNASVSERIAVHVVDPAPSRILILDASPSFELSSLRTWLARGEAAVAHRTAISSGIHREEFLNMRQTATRQITRALLEGFDLAIVDQGSLTMLSSSERRILRRAVAEDGLGLLILADETREKPALDRSDERFFIDAGWTTFPELENRTVRPQWIDGAGPATVPLPSYPAILEKHFGQATVIHDGTGGVLAQVASRGAGKVGLLAGVQTVPWRRHGMSDAYAGFWDRLLSHIARDPPGVDRWRLASPATPLIDRELHLEGRLDDEPDNITISSPTGAVDSVFLADIGGSRSGRFWPRDAGWHRIATPRGEHLFYVDGIDAWQTAAALRRSDATRRAALRSLGGTGPSTALVARPMQLGWVYGIFLVAAGLLWLAEDRRGEYSSE